MGKIPRLVLAAVLLGGLASAGLAQESRTRDPDNAADTKNGVQATDDAAPATRLQEAPLQILLRPDKNGALVPVPVFAPTDEGDLKQHVLSWSDIDQLLDRSADRSSPRVSCRQVSIQGEVQADRASLEIEFVFVTSSQRWVRAPLGLASAVISKFDAPSGGFLDFDEKDGFVVWMPPAPAQPSEPASSDEEATGQADDGMTMPMMPSLQLVERKVKLRAAVAIAESGVEKRLTLRIPRAPSSSLDLLVDMPDAQANLAGSDAVPNTEAADSGHTRISAQGVGGDMTVAWRPKRTTAPAAAPILKAQGVLEITLGENDQFTSNARLTVQSLSGPFQTFTVKLPPGARLAPVQSPEYDISLAPASGDAARDAQLKALVQLRQPTIGPVTVRLAATSAPQDRDGTYLEVGGFEILEAVEQWGRLSLIASGGQSVSWVESANIVQSSDAPTPPNAEEVAANFKYFAQPFSLLVKAAPQKTRVRVEPSYLIEVFPDHVKLTANLKYQIRGAKASFVRVDLQGWDLDSVGGDDVVNRDAVKYEQLAPLEIPFRTSVSGDVAVRITARRIIEGESGMVRVPLPTPAADFIVSALVSVAPSDNIELTPLAEQSHGLIPEPPAAVEEVTGQRKATLFYRTRTGEPQLVFSAGYEVKSGAVMIEADGEVRIREQSASIRQEFTYTFAYEPVDHLLVEAPREAFENGELHFLFDGAPLAAKEDGDPVNGRLRLRLEPPMTLGRHELTVESTWPLPEIAPQQSIACSLPLTIPVAGASPGETPTVTSNTLRVSFARPLKATPDESEWRLRSTVVPAGADELSLTTDAPCPQLPLIVTRQKPDEQLSNAIDRVWLGTWLTTTQRRDHVALQVTTHENRFRVRLPAGADHDTVIAFVNGRRLSADQLSVETAAAPSNGPPQAEVLSLDLAPFGTTQFAVELWYGFVEPRDRGWRTQLAAPEFLDISWVRQVYWQLVLPPNEHLAIAPSDLTSESVWRRNGWWWERQPALDQKALEQWSGASEQPVLEAPNVYLFSSFGAPRVLDAYTVHRSVAVLGLSGWILILGLLAIRSPPRRHLKWFGEIVLLASLALMVGVFVAPDLAILAGQSAALGLLGVVLAWIVARIGRQHRRGPVEPSVSWTTRRDKTSARSWPRSETRSSQATTPAGVPPASTT